MFNTYLGSMTEVISFHLNKMEAEFISYKKNDERRDAFASAHIYYKAEEVLAGDLIDKNSKEFKKFKEEKIKSINCAISKASDCSANDSKEIEKLNEELKIYE